MFRGLKIMRISRCKNEGAFCSILLDFGSKSLDWGLYVMCYVGNNIKFVLEKVTPFPPKDAKIIQLCPFRSVKGKIDPLHWISI